MESTGHPSEGYSKSKNEEEKIDIHVQDNQQLQKMTKKQINKKMVAENKNEANFVS